MSKDTKHTAHELRQSILSRMDAAKKGIEELSEEELESIVGGAQQHSANSSKMMRTGTTPNPHLCGAIAELNIADMMGRRGQQ